jgi:hypothetical protein
LPPEVQHGVIAQVRPFVSHYADTQAVMRQAHCTGFAHWLRFVR